jgi:hypothetical protein
MLEEKDVILNSLQGGNIVFPATATNLVSPGAFKDPTSVILFLYNLLSLWPAIS